MGRVMIKSCQGGRISTLVISTLVSDTLLQLRVTQKPLQWPFR